MVRPRHEAPWTLVAAIVAVDGALLVADGAHRAGSGTFTWWRWNAALDAGWFELFRGAQLLVAAVLLVLLAARLDRSLVLRLWALAFVALAVDDNAGLHESAGTMMARLLGLRRASGVGAQDQGELLVLVLGAAVLAAVLLVPHRRGGPAAQAVSRALMVGVGIMVVFGVVVDGLHAAVVEDRASFANYAFAMVEATGESAGAGVVLLVAVVAVRRWAAQRGHAGAAATGRRPGDGRGVDDASAPGALAAQVLRQGARGRAPA